MPTSTTNYELIKPGTDDPILIEQLNTNADIIDNALKENADALGGKVDKETGKGLSTNDFTNAEKTKLADLAKIKSIGTGLNLDSSTGELTATGGGGGGGTSNYNDLTNKPQINSVTLSGNKSLSDLGITYESETAASGGTALSLVTTGEKYAWNNKQNTISDLSAIRNGAALGSTAVQPETGKGLSTNDYTTAEKTKLAGIAEGAEVNVQSNWTQTTTTADDYIKNKPTLGTAAAKNATDTYNATGTDVTTGKAVAAAIATLPEPVTNVAVANGGGLTISGSPITSSGTITVGHSNSVTAKTSSSLKKFTYDKYGHVTGSSELSTAESNALASGIDSTKVAQIESNKNNISKDDAAIAELVEANRRKVYANTEDSKSYTFSNLYGLNESRFKYALVCGGGTANNPALAMIWFVFIDNSGVVTTRKIIGDSPRTLTGSVSGTTLTLTSDSTMYGGLRLIWLS